ncbi:MAG: phosphatase [Lachnospirales bacterium]
MQFVIDTHTHTVASGHGYSTAQENFISGEKNGMKAIGLSDHSVLMPGGAAAFHFACLDILPSYINGVKLYKSIELNILDENGAIDNYDTNIDCYLCNITDYAIASLHPPCINPQGLNATKALINVMNHKEINILGHLGDPRYKFDVNEVVKCAVDTNTAIELNDKSLIKGHMRYDAEFTSEILEAVIKYGAFITFGSDAHYCDDVGNFSHILEFIKDYTIDESKLLCTSLEKFEQFIGSKRS